MNVLWHRPNLDNLDLFRIRANALTVDNMSQKINLLGSKGGFSLTHVKFFTLENIQN
jgi:hypothetical protein